MRNFEFRPLNTDDLDAPHIEAASRRPGQSEHLEVMSFGHFGYYKSIGRTEVEPTPIDKDIYHNGIAYRFGAFPILEPTELHGAGIVREGSVLPGVEDNAWEYSADSRRLRRLPASELSDSFGVAGISSAGMKSGGVAVQRVMRLPSIPTRLLDSGQNPPTTTTGWSASVQCWQA